MCPTSERERERERERDRESVSQSLFDCIVQTEKPVELFPRADRNETTVFETSSPSQQQRRRRSHESVTRSHSPNPTERRLNVVTTVKTFIAENKLLSEKCVNLKADLLGDIFCC